MNVRRTTAMSIRSFLFAVLSVAAFAQTFGQTSGTASTKLTFHLDAAKTEIHWTLAATLHSVHGTFAAKSGLVTFDPQTGEAQGEVLIDVTSGQSGNRARDRKMHGDVLESAKFPEAIFHPEKVTGSVRAGAVQDLTVTGTITIHGSDHPLELPVQIRIAGKDATATTHFVVPYVDWGMKNPSGALTHVAKLVDVDVVAEGTVEGLQ